LRPAPGRLSLARGPSPGDLLTHVLLRFAALVVAYDALASAVVAATGWPYGVLALGGLAIQFAAGRVGGRREGLLWAIVAGACTALAEGTLGFAVSWLIGPGRTQLPVVVAYPTAVAIATLGGCALGALGGITALGWEVEAHELSPAALRSACRSFLRSLRLDGWLCRALLLRGLVIWAGLRLLFLLATSAAGNGGGVRLSFDLASGVRFMGVCALVAVADLAWRREFTLLANLGVRAGAAVALYVFPAALLEGLLLAVAR
jgi:hypothetical protein